MDYDLSKHTYISEQFSFEILQIIECSKCAEKSEVYEILYSIPIPIAGAKPFKLNNCIKEFFIPKKIMRTCKRCNMKTETLFTKFISRFPNICIIQIQRINALQEKFTNLIEYPLLDLNFSDFVCPELKKEENSLFDLYAVCNHKGISHKSGHYVTYSKDFSENKWYCFNDENFNQINEDKIMNSDGYILFYEKK